MNRLFIFAIGGTGSRVLKSLMMLLASGVKSAGRQFEVVPIIIDPHKDNKDLQRTNTLLQNYQKIVDEVGTNNGFFSTKVSTLDRLIPNKEKMEGKFTFDMDEIKNKTFRDYIEYNLLDESNKALIDLMFSGTSVNAGGEETDLINIDMNIGFVGNPNVGSVVLNQVKDSDVFREFANIYNENDRIFIISSIFGGTGAAGFPTILKNIRNAINNDQLSGKGFLQNAKIGAITVMPYFNVEADKKSAIQKSDWIAKTKAALHYYKNNVTGSKPLVNALYYIGDDYAGVPYKNDPGNDGQQNEAHFVELASALAVVEFMGIPDELLVTEEGIAVRPLYYEYGIKTDEPSVTLLNLGERTQKMLAKNITQLFFFKKHLDNAFKAAIGKQAYSTDDKPDSPAINNSFITRPFYGTYFSEFMSAFYQWLEEQSTNKRGFAPFNLRTELKASINGIGQNRGWLTKDVDYNLFNSNLSKASGQLGYKSAEQKFISIFYKATEELLIEKFDHFKNLAK